MTHIIIIMTIVAVLILAAIVTGIVLARRKARRLDKKKVEEVKETATLPPVSSPGKTEGEGKNNNKKEEDKKKDKKPSYWFFGLMDRIVVAGFTLFILSLTLAGTSFVFRGCTHLQSVPSYMRTNWDLRVYDGDELVGSQITAKFHELSEEGVSFTIKFNDRGKYSISEYTWNPKKETWGHWKRVLGGSQQNGRFRIKIPILREEATTERIKVFQRYNIPYTIIDNDYSLRKIEGLETIKGREGFTPKNERLKMVFYR